MGLFSRIFNTSNDENNIHITVSTSGDKPSPKKIEMSDNDTGLLASLDENKAKPIYQKLPFSDTCPYCGVIFEQPIKRKKNCSECKNPIYVRTTQSLYPSSALTEEQVNHAEFYETMKSSLGLTKDDYLSHENDLKKKWNMKTINTYDVLWSLFNDLDLYARSIDKSQDKKYQTIELFRIKRWVDVAAAQYQGNRGHDPSGYLAASHNNDIQSAKLDDYVKGLTVKCYDCCEACQKFDNKTFSIAFLEKKPVLPIPACTRPFKDGAKFTFCTCSYQNYYEWD
tara:strand:- start:7982 stop:8827 length:846 start_codon:yes stop_codon:yes gene_type:complete